MFIFWDLVSKVSILGLSLRTTAVVRNGAVSRWEWKLLAQMVKIFQIARV